MAQILRKKYGNGSGVFSCEVDTTVVTNLHTKRPIVTVVIDKDAYNALAAAGKTDIDNTTIANIIAAAFS